MVLRRKNTKKADAAVQVNIQSIVVVEDEAEDFIQCFYRKLSDQSTTSSGMYSIVDVRLAMEAAKRESSIQSAILAVETVKNECIGGISGGMLNSKEFSDEKSPVCKKVRKKILS